MKHTSWLSAEQERYQKIADEKAKEFESAVQANTEWLRGYVADMLGGHISTADISQLLKTPAMPRPTKNTVAKNYKVAAEVSVGPVQKPVQAKTAVETKKTAVVEVPKVSKPVIVSTTMQPPAAEPKKSEERDLNDYIKSVREKLLASRAAAAANKKTSSTASATKLPSPNKRPSDAKEDDEATVRAKKTKSNTGDANATTQSEEQLSTELVMKQQEDRIKSLVSAGTERLRSMLGNVKASMSFMTAADQSVLDKSKDTSIMTDASFALMSRPMDKEELKPDESMVADSVRFSIDQSVIVQDKPIEDPFGGDILPESLVSKADEKSFLLNEDSIVSAKVSPEKPPSRPIAPSQKPTMDNQPKNPALPTSAANALERVRAALNKKADAAPVPKSKLPQQQTSFNTSSAEHSFEAPKPLPKKPKTPKRFEVGGKKPLTITVPAPQPVQSSPALDPTQTILNKQGNEYALPEIPSEYSIF